MQSAEELVDRISDDCYTPDSHDCSECGWGQSSLAVDKMATLIRSRDMEIVEACRMAIQEMYLINLSATDENDILEALDTILYDLE